MSRSAPKTIYEHVRDNVEWLNSDPGLYGADGEEVLKGEGLVAPIIEVLAALGIDPSAPPPSPPAA